MRSEGAIERAGGAALVVGPVALVVRQQVWRAGRWWLMEWYSTLAQQERHQQMRRMRRWELAKRMGLNRGRQELRSQCWRPKSDAEGHRLAWDALMESACGDRSLTQDAVAALGGGGQGGLDMMGSCAGAL